ncbi:hypothetical protein FGO68_gene3966 [Halteria grandinella]|uniref:Uncharacterized protein n=1 Tax=Halteria grandinella TaxID=5974 RepID=A0A8J8TA67_HALGN|nr:hypothetical protein FGO68_gene3966 [Halteria grandinella]
MLVQGEYDFWNAYLMFLGAGQDSLRDQLLHCFHHRLTPLMMNIRNLLPMHLRLSLASVFWQVYLHARNFYLFKVQKGVFALM